MRRLLLLFLCGFLHAQAQGQSIAGTNVKYWYDLSSEVSWAWRVAADRDSIVVFYEMTANSATPLSGYRVQWEKREAFGQRSGEPVAASEKIIRDSERKKIGRLTFAVPAKPWLLTAIVTHTPSQARYLFVRQLEANYPPDGWIEADSVPLFTPFVASGKPTVMRYRTTTKDVTVFQYSTPFPAASPPFVEKEKRVAPALVADSLINTAPGVPLPFKNAGLYLAQLDTNAAKGFAFRIADANYPRFATLEQLVDPLVFVTTQEEFQQLKAATADKKAFDKVILDITGDAERAKNFMRNYFRRVEHANRLFTSYKEGWKTDRGMIYLIFGPPDEVSHTGSAEAWNYKNHKVRFTFVKSGTLYDPDNLVLVRDKRFAERWYYTIDLWRKSRY
ncbi:MAG: GWxTD domain-containing protein [Bacteroidota bacterium]